MSQASTSREHMEIEIVSIPTETYPLDGLLYLPRKGELKAMAMLLHGNCHNFYMGPSRFMPPFLTARGIGCLAFNRRGHDMVTSLDGRSIGGGAFQLAHEAIADNRHAAEFLKGRGFNSPVLIGHSNGGVLAAQHAADHPETPALVLMSAHRGGRGITEVLSRFGLFGKDRLDELQAEARKMIAEGRGRELMLIPGWWWVISPECLLDYGECMPETLANARRISMPTLALRGDQEPEELYPAQTFAELCSSAKSEVLPGCDHFYTGCEASVSEMISQWICATLRI